MENDPLEKEFAEQTLRSLYRKMKKTSKAYFNAAIRLRRHHQYSLWSLSFVSAGLIIMRLLSMLQIRGRLSEFAFSFTEIVLALFVLVISLLLSANNSSDKAEKMHRAGLELKLLCHQILPACRDNTDQALFSPTLEKYSTILNSYANHDNIDFDFVKLEYPKVYPLTFRQRCQIYVFYWLPYLIYGLLVAIPVGILLFVLVTLPKSVSP
jgi:hypothetical protein